VVNKYGDEDLDRKMQKTQVLTDMLCWIGSLKSISKIILIISGLLVFDPRMSTNLIGVMATIKVFVGNRTKSAVENSWF